MNGSGFRSRISTAVDWLSGGILPGVVSAAAFCVYVLRFLNVSKYLNINMDEGTYLVKGLLFTSGQYAPYQFYGPWTQKMPLAYFLFGWVQEVLGPGLSSGRYLSLLFTILLLAGIWLLTARLGGKWAAALAMVYLAANQAGIMKLAYATTQSQVACFGVWMLVFSIGFKPKNWQAAAAGVLAGLMVITRQNMLPFALLWLGYMFWVHERRPAQAALAAAGGVFLITHLIFWPNILSVWTLLPRSLTPFLDPWRLSAGIEPMIQWEDSLATQFDAFLEAIRYYFIPFFGVAFSLLLAPNRRQWANKSEYQTYLFLMASWFSLLLVHFGASFFLNYGFYTFSGYIAFFDYIALAIMALSFRRWRLAGSAFGKLASSAIILSIPTFLAFWNSAEMAIVVTWFQTPLPRFRLFQILPGNTNLVGILIYKFGIPLETLGWALPTFCGFLVGVLPFALAGLFKKMGKASDFVPTAAGLFLLFSVALTPTPVLGRGHPDLTCSFDVVQANAQAGKEVAALIPAGSAVFWYPWLAPTPFLYLNQPKIFPPQLDDNFTFVVGGDPDTVARLGFWNETLANQWLAQSGYLLIAEVDEENGRMIDDFYNRYGNKYALTRLGVSSQPISCTNRQNWRLFVYALQPK